MQISDGTLGVYCRKPSSSSAGRGSADIFCLSGADKYLTGSCLSKDCESWALSMRGRGSRRIEDKEVYSPTLEVASVKLFNVVLFPDEGLPTRPMRGSRGMVSEGEQRLIQLLHPCVVALEILSIRYGSWGELWLGLGMFQSEQANPD